MAEEILTLEEVAELLQMPPQVVARIKGLPAFRVGWQWRVRNRDLAKWMANHKLQRAVTS
jgi:hypothetical protein